MEDNKTHSITVENQRKISVLGVAEVQSVTPERITLVIVNGKKLAILGQNLKMGAFSKQSGSFTAEGSVQEIKYSTAKSTLIKKLFK